MALQNIRQKGAAVAAVAGLGALLAGCSTSARPELSASYSGTRDASAPVSVGCEPNQRAVVRQVAVNGGFQAQVECQSVIGVAGTTGTFGAASPMAYQPGVPAAMPVSYTQPMDNTRLVRAAYPQDAVTREAAPARVARYQPAPERVIVRQPKRSVKTSAIIIGSSAGVAAGIGAAVGGKKGAGIGALLGGGGAALWDQITRRQ